MTQCQNQPESSMESLVAFVEECGSSALKHLWQIPGTDEFIPNPTTDLHTLASELIRFDAAVITLAIRVADDRQRAGAKVRIYDHESAIDRRWERVDRDIAREVRRLFAVSHRIDVPGDLLSADGIPGRDDEHNPMYMLFLQRHDGDHMMARRAYREHEVREALHLIFCMHDQCDQRTGGRSERPTREILACRLERLADAMQRTEVQFDQLSKSTIEGEAARAMAVRTLRNAAAHAGQIFLESDSIEPINVSAPANSWLTYARYADLAGGFLKVETPIASTSLHGRSIADALSVITALHSVLDKCDPLRQSSELASDFLNRHVYFELAARLLPKRDQSFGLILGFGRLTLTKANNSEVQLICDGSSTPGGGEFVANLNAIARQCALTAREVATWLTRDLHGKSTIFSEPPRDSKSTLGHDAVKLLVGMELRNEAKHPRDLSGRICAWGHAENSVIFRFPIDVVEGIAMGAMRFASDAERITATPCAVDRSPTANLAKEWTARAEKAERARNDERRKLRRDSAPSRVLTAASRWRERGRVPWSLDLALRFRAIAALLRRLGVPRVILPDGLVAVHCQWALDEAAAHRPGWRSRIASRLQGVYDAAAAAGLVGMSTEDERAWQADPNPPRDSIRYLRTFDWRIGLDNLYRDIARAAGIIDSPLDRVALGDRSDAHPAPDSELHVDTSFSTEGRGTDGQTEHRISTSVGSKPRRNAKGTKFAGTDVFGQVASIKAKLENRDSLKVIAAAIRREVPSIECSERTLRRAVRLAVPAIAPETVNRRRLYRSDQVIAAFLAYVKRGDSGDAGQTRRHRTSSDK